MKFLAALVPCALYAFAALPADARPLVIEESAVLTNPDPVKYPSFGYEVATNGTDALVLAADVSNEELRHHYVLRFQKSRSAWLYRGELLHAQIDRGGEDRVFPSEIALRGDLAAIALQGSPHLYRLTASGLVDLGGFGGPTNDIEIEGNRIAWGEGEAWHAAVGDVDANGHLS